MPSMAARLATRELCRPPAFLSANTHYETLMGSEAYGVATDISDRDVYGFCIPPKTMVFPHLAGEIPGFGRQINRFEQWQEHHVHDHDAQGGRGCTWDLTIFSIVKYFQLLMDNNPNMLDSLFTPQDCVLHCTAIGGMVRDNRRLFLHKGSWHKFKGYAYSQLHKMDGKNPQPDSKRSQLREQFGFDVKFAYHVVRLVYEVEQILTTGDIDLRRDREHLKAIRRGMIPQDEIRKWFSEKEKQLEQLYHSENCPVPYAPPQDKIKTLLLECLEHHYGSLSEAIAVPTAAEDALREIQQIANRALASREASLKVG